MVQHLQLVDALYSIPPRDCITPSSAHAQSQYPDLQSSDIAHKIEQVLTTDRCRLRAQRHRLRAQVGVATCLRKHVFYIFLPHALLSGRTLMVVLVGYACKIKRLETLIMKEILRSI
jgi:hypothetical protein